MWGDRTPPCGTPCRIFHIPTPWVICDPSDLGRNREVVEESDQDAEIHRIGRTRKDKGDKNASMIESSHV